jgi:hypothetical protein
MFNNANVIFRTKFVDGVSTVTRTLGKSRPNAEEQETFPAKKRAAVRRSSEKEN